jgi:hypothetical protein
MFRVSRETALVKPSPYKPQNKSKDDYSSRHPQQHKQYLEKNNEQQNNRDTRRQICDQILPPMAAPFSKHPIPSLDRQKKTLRI